MSLRPQFTDAEWRTFQMAPVVAFSLVAATKGAVPPKQLEVFHTMLGQSASQKDELVREVFSSLILEIAPVTDASKGGTLEDKLTRIQEAGHLAATKAPEHAEAFAGAIMLMCNDVAAASGSGGGGLFHRKGPSKEDLQNRVEAVEKMIMLPLTLHLHTASAPATSSPAVATPDGPAPASAAGGQRPTVVKFESTAPEKTQKAIELAEDYMDRGHPADAMMGMLGVLPTKPVYKVVQGNVGRESQPQVDMKIVSVASCLPDEEVDASDATAVARLAFNAIEHYASLPKVQALFLLPYRVRAGTMTEGSAVPPEETCRVYAGVENLLLEIYDELPAGGTITDKVVEQKVDALIQSVQ